MRRGLARAMLLMSLLPVTACNGSNDAIQTTASSQTTEPAEAWEVPAGQRATVEAIAGAIDALLRHPAVEVSIEADDGGGVDSTVEAVVDLTVPAYRSREELRTGAGEVLVSEQFVVDGVLYSRITQLPAEPAQWFASPVDEVLATDLRDGSLLWFEAAGSSLERLVELLESVPFTARQLGDDLSESRFLVTFEAADVYEYFRRTGIEAVGLSPPSGQMRYEFWFDGELTELIADGVQFHDGEAVDGQRIHIRYLPLSSAEVVAPTG